jgi:hypothetical protein
VTADQAQPGDIVLDGNGKAWQRGADRTDWSTFEGPVLHFGEWLDSYGPQGDLTLLVRDGRAAIGGPEAA